MRKKIWAIVFAVGILYLFGTVGAIEMAEAAGETISFFGSCSHIIIGIITIVVSGIYGGIFE